MMSSKTERTKSVIIYGVMALYIAMLLFLMLFSFAGAIRAEQRSVNLVPFRSIIEYLPYLFSGSHSLVNLLGNIVMFAPIGIYAALLRKDKRVFPNLLCVFIFSLTVEIIQYILARGVSDIDDILLNCLGGLLGIFTYRVMLRLLKTDRKTRTAIAVISAAALPLILFFFAGSVRAYFIYMANR